MGHVLAGDIGGTKALLALYGHDGTRLVPVREGRYESALFDGLTPLVRSFLEGAETRIEAACFGIAGPVTGDECRGLNLPWMVHRGRLAEEIGVPRTILLNDFEAVGHGLARLSPADLAPLQEAAASPREPVALIGAGTGLGEGYITWEGERARVHRSEGGHVDFAPRDETEWRLRERLSTIHGHVSYERILSGPGLAELYRFVVETEIAPGSGAIDQEMERGDDAAVITSHALAGNDAACARALDLFVSIYGAEAGNLALKIMARGGVYVAGGIAPRIIEKLRDGAFIRAFRDKGRHSDLLASIPVQVVVNEKVGLLGAASVAAGMAEESRAR